MHGSPALAGRREPSETPPPAASDLVRYSDVRLPTGVRLRYAERGDPAGAPVILLHGYSDSSFSFSPVLPLLPADHHAFALDQRGHGGSDRPDRGYAMRDLAADVVAFMDHLGIARATVVGHSMGSFVAQQVGLAAPERLAGLVLVGSTARPGEGPAVRELAVAVEALPDPVPEAFVREFQASTVHRPLPDDFMDRVVAESLTLPSRVWRALMAGMLATGAAEGLGAQGIPTLLLWGDRDTVFSRADQDELLALLPGATLEVYPDTGHALHWERPAEFVRDLQAFMTGAGAA